MTELSSTARLDELLLMLGTPPYSCHPCGQSLLLQLLANPCSQARRRGSTAPSKPSSRSWRTAGSTSRRREFCHFADVPSASLLKHLPKGVYHFDDTAFVSRLIRLPNAQWGAINETVLLLASPPHHY